MAEAYAASRKNGRSVCFGGTGDDGAGADENWMGKGELDLVALGSRVTSGLPDAFLLAGTLRMFCERGIEGVRSSDVEEAETLGQVIRCWAQSAFWHLAF